MPARPDAGTPVVTTERVRLTSDDVSVSAVVHAPARPVGPAALVVPGAGGTLDGDGLVALAGTLAALRHPVVRANLPHHETGARPPRADRSVPAYFAVLAAARAQVGRRRPWIVGGKSYGGRVASLGAAQGLAAHGLVFYGYPLHPPGKPDQLRIEHWPAIPVPCLFLQGDRDPFCDLDRLHASVRRLPRRATIEVVAGADHSLRITRAASPSGVASSAATTIASLRDVLRNWINALTP